MSPSFLKLILPVFLLSGTALLAQEPAFNPVPVSGDDICQVLGIAVQKVEIDFGAPKFLTVRTEYHGHSSNLPVNLPAVRKVTLMTYVQSKKGHMQYWLSGEGHGMSAFVNFVLGEGDSTLSGRVDGVYTVQGAHSMEDLRPHPAWKMELIASDVKPEPTPASPMQK